MKLVLDTHIYCDFAKGIPEVVEAMAEFGENLFMPSIVLGELNYGFMKGKKRQSNEQKLFQVIRRLQIEIIPVNADVDGKYGAIFISLEKKRAKIAINDVWIAACCMEIGGTLLTRDQQFKQVDQIEAIVL